MDNLLIKKHVFNVIVIKYYRYEIWRSNKNKGRVCDTATPQREARELYTDWIAATSALTQICPT